MSAPAPMAPHPPDVLLNRVLDGQPLLADGAVRLLGLSDAGALAALRHTADALRQRVAGDAVTVRASLSLFLTTHCEMRPCLYPYWKQEDALSTLTIEDIAARLEAASGVQEILISGGFCSTLCVPGLEAPTVLKTHAKLLGYLREHAPHLAITGFSPDEIDFLSVVSQRSPRYVLEFLKDHGLTLLGGHDAEVLTDGVRQKVSPKKASVRDWWQMVETAWSLGLPTALTMTYGGFDTVADRVADLQQVRAFAEKHPGALLRWRPQPMPDSTALREAALKPPTPRESLALLAVARLLFAEALPALETVWSLPASHREAALPPVFEAAEEGLTWGANGLGATDALERLAFLTAHPWDDAVSQARAWLQDQKSQTR